MSTVRQKKTGRHHRFDRQNIRIPIIEIKKEPDEVDTTDSCANVRSPSELSNGMGEILGLYSSIRPDRAASEQNIKDESSEESSRELQSGYRELNSMERSSKDPDSTERDLNSVRRGSGHLNPTEKDSGDPDSIEKEYRDLNYTGRSSKHLNARKRIDRSSREKSPRDRSPGYPTSQSGSHKSYSAESEDEELVMFDTCGWCHSRIFSKSQFSIGGNLFCSEVCFIQYRRASFKEKKTKSCDWCQHVRQSVNYVGFQQLQFCSNKCLNQYKMNIFCKETREHLELHRHITETETQLATIHTGDSSLITPELWMNNHEDSPPRLDVHSSSNTPSPPQRHVIPPLNGAMMSLTQPRNSSKTSQVKKQSKNDKFLHMTLPHVTRPNPSYRSPFQPPNMFNHQALRNPPPLLRMRGPAIPAQRSPAPLPRPVPTAMPPPTTLVPYPYFVPIPLPIPIVLPFPVKPEEFQQIVNGTSNVNNLAAFQQIANGKNNDTSHAFRHILNGTRNAQNLEEFMRITNKTNDAHNPEAFLHNVNGTKNAQISETFLRITEANNKRSDSQDDRPMKKRKKVTGVQYGGNENRGVDRDRVKEPIDNIETVCNRVENQIENKETDCERVKDPIENIEIVRDKVNPIIILTDNTDGMISIRKGSPCRMSKKQWKICKRIQN